MINKNERWPFKFLLVQAVFWIGILSIFNIRQYSAGPIICIAYLGWYLLEKKPIRKFMILLSGLPFQAVTKLAVGVPSVSVLLYFVFIIERVVETKGKVKGRMLLGVIGILLLQILATMRYNLSASTFISTLLTILFATYAGLSLKDSSDPTETFVECGWVFGLSMLIDIYSVSAYSQLPYYILRDKQLVLDRIGRFCALNGDPNYFGQLISVAFGLMVSMAIIYYRERNNKRCALCIILSVVFVLNGMRSISKGYAFAIAATILMCAWFIIMEKRSSNQRIIYFVLFVVIGIPLVYLLVDKIVLPIVQMRSETDLFTGRLGIWSMYGDMLESDPSIAFLGTGFSNAQNAIRMLTGHTAAAHNLYIEVFCDLGIIGLIMVLLIWSDIFGNLKLLLSNSMSIFAWGFLFTSLSLSASANDVIYFIVPMFGLVCASELNETPESELHNDIW